MRLSITLLQSMMLTSSTSNTSVAFGGMTGGFPEARDGFSAPRSLERTHAMLDPPRGTPFAPYACSGGMVSTAFSPTDIVSSAASHPAMSLPTPAFTTLQKGVSAWRYRTR